MIPESKLQEFIQRARTAAGDNLQSIILYGSAVDERSYRDKYSDLNLFCVLRDISYPSLLALAHLAKWWNDQKQPPPLLMTQAELESSTDVFTIELLDMKEQHRVLFGDDVLSGLKIPMHRHRVQVEYELREKLLLLRQRALLAGDKEQQLWELLLHSVPSFATLIRHALIALGKQAPPAKRDAVTELSRTVHYDANSIQQVLDVREHKLDRKAVDVRKLFAEYLAAIEKITAAVDQALNSGESRG